MLKNLFITGAAFLFVFISTPLFSQTLESMEGLGKSNAGKLNSTGIKSQKDLLEKCDTKAKRDAVSKETGISTEMSLRWANRVDLARINGVGAQYSELLEVAGVDSPLELTKRNPENLEAKLKEVNEQKKVVKKLPTKKMIEKWIEDAKKLPKVIN